MSHNLCRWFGTHGLGTKLLGSIQTPQSDEEIYQTDSRLLCLSIYLQLSLLLQLSVSSLPCLIFWWQCETFFLIIEWWWVTLSLLQLIRTEIFLGCSTGPMQLREWMSLSGSEIYWNMCSYFGPPYFSEWTEERHCCCTGYYTIPVHSTLGCRGSWI